MQSADAGGSPKLQADNAHLPPKMQVGATLQAQVEEAVRGFQGPDNELLCFPMSLGDPCMDKDHSGEPCTVLDVVYATQVLQMAEASRHALTCQLLLSGQKDVSSISREACTCYSNNMMGRPPMLKELEAPMRR